MKYKVIKEFGCLKKGDILENSVEEPEIFTFEEENDNKYRYFSISDDLLNEYIEDEYVIEIADTEEENDDEESYADHLENLICKTVDEIDKLLESYEKDKEEAKTKYEAKQISTHDMVEAETVYANLEKVLNHIRAILVGEKS